MHEKNQNVPPPSGPFGLGWEGYLIIAIVILGTALFAATRRDWTSMLASALVPPLIMFPLIFVLGHHRPGGAKVSERRTGPRKDIDLITFLARTNPIMFLFFGALSRRTDDRYQELLRSGPYGMGQYGYLIALAVVLCPLILALIITAATGQLPAHGAPDFH